MESIAFDGMCRCCASEGVFKDLRSAYEWMGEVEVYADMIEECFNISMSMVENVNNGGICEVCITQLRNASNFKKQVQQTEGKFLKKIQDGQMTSNELKIEMTKDEPDDSYDATASDNEFFDPEYDIPIKNIKIEKEEAAKPKKRAAKASTSRAKKAKADDDAEPAAKRSKRVIVIKVEKKDEDPEMKVIKNISLRSVYRSQRSYSREMYKHRQNIKEILDHSNATPIRCQIGISYLCSFCDNQYIDPADLKKHNLDAHIGLNETHFKKRLDLARYIVKLDITNLTCNLCAENKNSLEEMINHLKDIHNRTLFTDIKNQIVPFKFDAGPLKCCICCSEFSKFKVLLEHMHTHYKNYICEICDTGYVNRKNLSIHAGTHKTGTFACNYCPKIFETKLKKNSHERSVHNHNLKNLLNKCPFCEERFNGGRKRERHMVQVHGVRQQSLQCQACEKSFLTQDALTIHKKRDHLMLRKYSCTLCDKTFYSNMELKNHMVKHTGVKEFVCEVCHKAYGRRKTLIEHLRIHADDRRFKCEHCGQAFVQKCSWRGHMRTKHGEDV